MYREMFSSIVNGQISTTSNWDCYYQSQLCWSEYHKWGDNFARVAKTITTLKIECTHTNLQTDVKC